MKSLSMTIPMYSPFESTIGILLILLFAARVSGIYQRSSIKAIEAVEVAEN